MTGDIVMDDQDVGRPDPNCEYCDGYGGWWARTLGNGAAWEIRPDEQDDGVGYTVCPCFARPLDD